MMEITESLSLYYLYKWSWMFFNKYNYSRNLTVSWCYSQTRTIALKSSTKKKRNIACMSDEIEETEISM